MILTHKMTLLEAVRENPGQTARWYKQQSERLKPIKSPNWCYLIKDLVNEGSLIKKYGYEEGSRVKRVVLFPGGEK